VILHQGPVRPKHPDAFQEAPSGVPGLDHTPLFGQVRPRGILRSGLGVGHFQARSHLLEGELAIGPSLVINRLQEYRLKFEARDRVQESAAVVRAEAVKGDQGVVRAEGGVERTELPAQRFHVATPQGLGCVSQVPEDRGVEHDRIGASDRSRSSIANGFCCWLSVDNREWTVEGQRLNTNSVNAARSA